MTVDVELYAGAGGTSTGAARAGVRAVGIELDRDACRTAHAAGHLRVRADVAAYPTAPFGDVRVLLASPPCQAFSRAGQRLGHLDIGRLHNLIGRYAHGADACHWREYTWDDDRSHHAAQPMRWIHDLRPQAVFLEQVPDVLELWQHIGRLLAKLWGYSVWVGKLNSADLGVPQTRVRAILLASRVHPVRPPEPTHYDPRRGVAMVGRPWVSMADALGWGAGHRPAPTVTGGGTGSGGGVEVFAGREAREVAYRNGNRERADGRPLTVPAPTVHFGDSANKVEWIISTRRDGPGWVASDGERDNRHLDDPSPTVTAEAHRWTWDRPATTVAADPRIPPPGHRDRAGGERQHADSVKVTVQEAAILQGMPPDYPWQGSKTSQYAQVGNLVPPTLAEACVRVLLGREVADAA